MSFFSDIGDRIKKAVTPPKDPRNITRAVAAPITGGLSLIAPNSVIDAARKGIRYAGVVAQTTVAPVLPAATQRKIFGLSAGESAIAETGQKIGRGIWAAAAVAGAYTVAPTLIPASWKGAGATAAAARGAVPASAAKTGLPPGLPSEQDPVLNFAARKNYVELPNNPAPVVSATNYVELARPSSDTAAQLAIKTAATTTKASSSDGASFLSRLKTKGLDVIETGLIVGGARSFGRDGSAGGGVPDNAAPQPSGGGSSINPSITATPSAASGGAPDAGSSQMTTLVLVVVGVLVAGAAWLWMRKRA